MFKVPVDMLNAVATLAGQILKNIDISPCSGKDFRSKRKYI